MQIKTCCIYLRFDRNQAGHQQCGCIILTDTCTARSFVFTVSIASYANKNKRSRLDRRCSLHCEVVSLEIFDDRNEPSTHDWKMPYARRPGETSNSFSWSVKVWSMKALDARSTFFFSRNPTRPAPSTFSLEISNATNFYNTTTTTGRE